MIEFAREGGKAAIFQGSVFVNFDGLCVCKQRKGCLQKSLF